MKNRDIYQKDPSQQKLKNDGVASVNDDRSRAAMDVLRYELETFVCDGQYEKGMAHILETYLDNLKQPEQPAVWISGFFGSGKSHLAKMLRALWLDTPFPDGATARGIANLPSGIKDLFKELTTQGRRSGGGLHAASGTLGSGAEGSVRLALLRIIFKSAGLPGSYPVARFVIWLKSEGIHDAVKARVEGGNCNWEEELDNLYVAESLHAALMAVRPEQFTSPAVCVETLNNLYPFVQDVSSDEMLKAIRQTVIQNGKFPLTLIVLDEVQQYIGGDTQRSRAVQEMVEACCKNIGGKILFIGTGQTSMTGTSNLKKLEGRFTVRVELSDADVEAVVRKVILAKKPEAIGPVREMLQTNLGEISRHLAGTSITHREDDIPAFPQDYPILPVRRRFWEQTLRVLDRTGTDSQLRNQLSMVHKAIQTHLDAPLGTVIPADYLYFDAADKLLQHRLLPRKVHENTMTWRNGSETDQLMARACGLVFLINKLAGFNSEIGIRATAETVADLMVEDLPAGGGALRNALPELLDGCELLMKVGSEYRIQTEESAAWSDEFHNQRSQLANEAHRIDAERDDRIRKRFGERVHKPSLVHGKSKVPRTVSPAFDAQLPSDADGKIYAWVRDGWNVDEQTVRADALQSGNGSPTVFVFVPRRSADDLRRRLIDFKAANATLEKRGVPAGPEGQEARAAMETTRRTADARINELLDDAFSGARVFQGGGNEITGGDLRDRVLEAADHSLQRLYPQFHLADHPGWDKVLSRAQKGSPDALKAVGFDGETSGHPVSRAILGYIAGGKTGARIRDHFEAPPYGWPRDAVDGGLQVLLVAGVIRAEDDGGRVIDPKAMDRKKIGRSRFKVEATTVTTAQRIQIRKVLQKAGVTAKQREELMAVPDFLQKLEALNARAGGDPPRPERPDPSALEDIRLSAGNEQLLAIYNRRDELRQWIDDWRGLAEKIDKRIPGWEQLERLLAHARDLPDAETHRARADKIRDQRLLLNDPDLVKPAVAALAQILRDALNQADSAYRTGHEAGMDRLRDDANWDKLNPEQRNELLAEQKLTEKDRPKIRVDSTDEILRTLTAAPLNALADRIAALPGRFDQVIKAAAEIVEPEIQFVPVSRRTLKTETDVDAWLAEVREKLTEALKTGPVAVK